MCFWSMYGYVRHVGFVCSTSFPLHAAQQRSRYWRADELAAAQLLSPEDVLVASETFRAVARTVPYCKALRIWCTKPMRTIIRKKYGILRVVTCAIFLLRIKKTTPRVDS